MASHRLRVSLACLAERAMAQLERLADLIDVLDPNAVSCPTCDSASPGRCCGCDEPIGEAQQLRPCPYASEINASEEPHLLCEDCHAQRLDDI